MSERVELAVIVESFEPWDERPELKGFDSPHPVDPVWDEFTDEQREATLYLVRDGLFQLMKTADEWVPTSFKSKDQDRLDVTITFDLGKVDATVLAQQLTGDREYNRILDRIANMNERYNRDVR